MSPATWTAASGSFSAARRLALLPAGHPHRNLHGHNFRATVLAALPAGWAEFPGAETRCLREHLDDRLRRLRHADLDEVLSPAADDDLARWILGGLELPGPARIAVSSTADQGVDLEADGAAHAWRRFRFEAAHRLPNVPAGHKCGRMHGHGFAVILRMRTQPSGVGGIFDALDAAWSALRGDLEMRCLNDLPGLENPTSEMLSSWIWQRVATRLPQLSGVVVFETASCGAAFDGQGYRIWKDFSLDSATRLRRAPEGAPERAIHGHTYELRLFLAAPIDAVLGWAIDFGDVKAIFDPLFHRLDHRPLHEIAGLEDADTASLADWIFRETIESLPALERVDLYETAGCGCVRATDPGGPMLPA